MPNQMQFSPSEVTRLGQLFYEDSIKSRVEPDHVGDFLVVDVETGDYAIGQDYIQPTESLLKIRPNAPLFAMRIGYRSLGRIGAHYTPARQ